jgi:hypothetical protein
MRVEQAQAKKGPNGVLLRVLMGLALVAGALLSMGSAPTELATSSELTTFFIEVAKPGAAEAASTTPDSISPGEEIAERDSLDLQLD